MLQFAGKYLGMYIGPEAGDKSWDSPLAKYVERCTYIKSLKLGLFFTICFYRMFAVSTLMFTSQFSRPPASVLVEESRQLTNLVPGPGNWIWLEELWNLDRLFHFPCAFPSIQLSALAARYRILTTEVPEAEFVSRRFFEWTADENFQLQSPWPGWHKSCLSVVLAETRADLESQGVDLDALKRRCNRSSAVSRPQQRSVQSMCIRALRDMSCNTLFLENVARRNLSRWVENELLPRNLGGFSRRIVKVFAILGTSVPPCVLSAVIRTLCNGWCTRRRFQQRSSHTCLLDHACGRGFYRTLLSVSTGTDLCSVQPAGAFMGQSIARVPAAFQFAP